jgi:hypothetical protein
MFFTTLEKRKDIGESDRLSIFIILERILKAMARSREVILLFFVIGLITLFCAQSKKARNVYLY